MSRRSLRLLPLMLLAAALWMALAVPSVAAGGYTVVTPVSFTLTSDQCPEIGTAWVQGSGKYVDRIREIGGRRSTTIQQIDSTATGTAVDDQGNHYTFYYHLVGTAMINNRTGATTLTFYDHFELRGSGPAGDVLVEFFARLGPDYYNIYPKIGNPACDPI